MTDSITVFEPINAIDPRPVSLAERPARLAGLRLGVLDNGKPNSDRFLALLAARMEAAAGLRVAVTCRKPSIGRLAPLEVVDELQNGSDLVLTGVGDCAGCCSCTIADAIALEKKGIPVAAVCTTEFVTTAALAAAAAGAAGYPVAVLPHPFGSCTFDELSQRADCLSHDTLNLLVAQVEKAPQAR